MPAEEVERALTQLTNAELMFRRGVPPDAEYTFKHALVQDAAYETLLRNQRQALHARIASTIETRFPEIVETRPELLAHHFTLAGLPQQGIDLLAASRRSSRQELQLSTSRRLITPSLLPEPKS
jgi:predicted ATPase